MLGLGLGIYRPYNPTLFGSVWTPAYYASDLMNRYEMYDGSTSLNALVSADFVSANSEYLSSTDASLQPSTSFSTGCWVKFDALPSSGNNRVIDQDGSGNRSFSLTVQSGSDNFIAYIWQSDLATKQINHTTTLSTGVWYFVVVVFDDTNDLYKISLDGTTFQTVVCNSINSTTQPFAIGSGWNFTSAYCIDGQIDAPFFYDKALTLAEVQTLYNSGNGTDYSVLTNYNGNTLPIAQDFTAASSQYLSSASTDFDKGNESFSFGCWVNVDNLISAKVLIGKWNNDTSNSSYILRVETSGKCRFYLSHDGSTLTNVESTSTVSALTWVFIVGVYDSVNDLMKISVNGSSFDTLANSVGAYSSSTEDFKIGVQSGTTPIYLDGKQDVPFFYDKALSLAEVQALYNSGNGVSYSDLTTAQKTSLVSWWEMNDVEGANQTDSVTLSGNDLTPTNTPISTTGKVNDTTIASIESSLVSWWKLNEVSGNRFDEHGSNTLTDNNTVGIADGKVQEAITSGDVVADFVSANTEYLSSSSSDFTKTDSDFSWGCWVKWDNIGDDYTGIMGKYASGGGGNYSYAILGRLGKIRIYASNNGTNLTHNILHSSTPVNGTWYFVVAVHDSVNDLLKLSVDGGTFETVAISGGVHSASGTDFNIGRVFISSVDEMFDGTIDAPFFYDKALSQAEVNALYNNGIRLKYTDLTLGQQTDLVAYWDLDEESGSRYDAHNPTTDNAIVLDGSTDALNIDSVLTPLASTTSGEIEFYFTPTDATPLANNFIVNFGDTVGSDTRVSIYMNTLGKLGVITVNNGTVTGNLLTDSAVFSDGVSAKVNVIQDGTGSVIKIDDVEVAQTESGSDPTEWFNDLTNLDNGRIGCYNNNGSGNSFWTNGIIQNIKIWSDATQTTLVAYYTMDEESGTRADSSGNGYDATVIGTPDFISLSTMLKDNNTVGFGYYRAYEPIYLVTDTGTQGFHLTQSTVTKQPLATVNGAKFDNLDDGLNYNTSTYTSHEYGFFYFKFKFETGVNNFIIGFPDNAVNTRGIYVAGLASNVLRLYIADGSTTNTIHWDTALVDGESYWGVVGSTSSGYYMNINGDTNWTLTGGSDNGNWLADVPNRDHINIGWYDRSTILYGGGEMIEVGYVYLDPTNAAAEIPKIMKYLENL